MIAHLQVIYINGRKAPGCDHTMASSPPRSLCAWHADSDQIHGLLLVADVFVASYSGFFSWRRKGLA